MIPYSEFVTRVHSIRIDAHDPRLAHFLEEISTEESAAGRGMLTALVVHKRGDLQPGPGFFLRSALGTILLTSSSSGSRRSRGCLALGTIRPFGTSELSYAQDKVGLESNRSKTRRPPYSRHEVSRSRNADEPVRRLDAISWPQRTPSQGVVGRPDFVAAFPSPLPPRALHGWPHRHSKQNYQESWSEIHPPPPEAPRATWSCYPALSLFGGPESLSSTRTSQTHSERSCVTSEDGGSPTSGCTRRPPDGDGRG